MFIQCFCMFLYICVWVHVHAVCVSIQYVYMGPLEKKNLGLFTQIPYCLAWDLNQQPCGWSLKPGAHMCCPRGPRGLTSYPYDIFITPRLQLRPRILSLSHEESSPPPSPSLSIQQGLLILWLHMVSITHQVDIDSLR